MTTLGLKLFAAECQFLIKGPNHLKSPTVSLCWPKTYSRHQSTTSATNNDIQAKNQKLIYEGKLTKRVLYLKSLSIVSSLGLGVSYGYVYSQKGFSVALAGVGFAFVPFLLSPFVIAWFFKRYVTKLYYDNQTDTYTAHHYGLFLNKRQCQFKKEDVMRSEAMLNTFSVGRRPFFVHDEDLIDLESIEIYKRMLGLNNLVSENNKSKPQQKL